MTLSKSNDQLNHDAESCNVHECAICKQEKPFTMPEEIISAYKQGNLVIFAGAGVSTETSDVYPFTFQELIKDELGIPPNEKIELPKLLSLYCKPPRSRKDLLRIIKERIDYVKGYSEFYTFATSFHRKLALIPHLNEIFTTNWDDFFEKECDATPIVTGQDFAVFQDVGGRTVFKLHGSIYNYGSIVATEEDYKKCYQRLSTGIIGANLKLLLMSKTIVFVGFSFDDNDFQRLYRLLKKDVSGLIPQSYVVTLDENAQEKLNALSINATAIVTSAVFFVEQFRKRLVKDKLMLSADKFAKIFKTRQIIEKENAKLRTFKLKNYPDLIYAYYYMDGLIHTIDYLILKSKSGVNSCRDHVLAELLELGRIAKTYLAEKKYTDATYVKGRQQALAYFIADNDEKLPIFFVFGSKKKIESFDEFSKILVDAEKLHKAAHKMAQDYIGANYPDDLFPHHAPFI